MVMVVMHLVLVVMVMARGRTTHLVHVMHEVLIVAIIKGVYKFPLTLKLAGFLAGHDGLNRVRDEVLLARVTLLHAALLALNHGASVLVRRSILAGLLCTNSCRYLLLLLFLRLSLNASFVCASGSTA